MLVTSAEMGPLTMVLISLITFLKSFPDLYIKVGFVVTPSTKPSSDRDLISSISAVSIKNFVAQN